MTDILGYAYAVALLFGGLNGLNHEDPKISLQAGILNAAGAAYGSYAIGKNPNDFYALLFVAAFNAIFAGIKACPTNNKIAFGISIASIGMLLKMFL